MAPHKSQHRRSNNFQKKAAVIWLIVISFSLVNIITLASWYNNSATATSNNIQPADATDYLSGSAAPVSNTSQARELRALVQQVNSLTKEHSQFRNDIVGKIDGLKKEIDNAVLLAAASRSTTSDAGRIYRVHLWDDSTLPNGFREKELYSTEGFKTHPRTTLVDSPEDADIVVWVSVRGHMEAEIPPSNYSNVVLLDYSDGCGPMHQKRGELKHEIGYFKRSFVSRNEVGAYSGNCTSEKDIIPIAYSGIDYLINKDMKKERNITITNVLRTGNGHNTIRKKIVNWTKAFVEQHNDDLLESSQSFVGNIGNGGSGSNWDSEYKAHLENSKIIVTCNPYQWEGDFRLWESLMSGALVMVDRMAILDMMPYPLKHKKHLVFYDSNNQTEFVELLEYYVKNEDEARQIGEAGYRYVLDHHMPKDRVSYILDKIESKIEHHDYKQLNVAEQNDSPIGTAACALEGSMDPPAERIIIDYGKINDMSKAPLERVKDYTAERYTQYLLGPAGKEHYNFLNFISMTYGDCRHLMDIGTGYVTSALAMGSNQKSPAWTFDLPDSTERHEAFRGESEEEWQKKVQGVGVDIKFHNLDLMKLSDTELKKYIGTWFIMLDTHHLPDTVPFEREFFQRLLDLGFTGILGLDDIHLNDEMKNWWKEVQDNAMKGGYTTYDLTTVGHDTGTGLVDFSGKVTIKQ